MTQVSFKDFMVANALNSSGIIDVSYINTGSINSADGGDINLIIIIVASSAVFILAIVLVILAIKLRRQKLLMVKQRNQSKKATESANQAPPAPVIQNPVVNEQIDGSSESERDERKNGKRSPRNIPHRSSHNSSHHSPHSKRRGRKPESEKKINAHPEVRRSRQTLQQ